jgi:hypothetical protein
MGSTSRVGGRQLRARLFSTEQVYKAAFTNELVRLGIQPSSASNAANAVWNALGKRNAPEGQKVYALVASSKDGWTVELCWRRASGGPLYKLGKSGGTKLAEVELPEQAFAVIPISDILESISTKLSTLTPEA